MQRTSADVSHIAGQRLEQAKLDVSYKTRANLFNWRGQFTPELIEYFLDCYACPDDIVVDPFAGSGTVLLESARRQLDAHGFEINPAAYTMSKFYGLCALDRRSRAELLDCFEGHLLRQTQPVSALPLFSDGDTFREQHHNLVAFTKDLFPTLERGWDKILALNLLFRCEGQKSTDLGETVLAAWYPLKRAALNLPYTERAITAQLCDARSAHIQVSNQPTLLLTSPPYINVFNYHQNHRALLEAVGWDMLKVAASEFGSNRKNRGNRFKTVIQYCLDMETALLGFWQLLQTDGRMILVVGRESNVRSSPFYNGLIVEHLLEGINGFTQEAKRERQFLNKFGDTIVEDILIYRKTAQPDARSIGRKVAVRHLEAALPNAHDEAKRDIRTAIMEVDTVTGSPLFSAKDAYGCVENAS
jgi:hypothetical protein